MQHDIESGDDAKDKNAALIMTYFHPWTLLPHLEDSQVPHLHVWRDEDLSWQERLRSWLEGGIGCVASKQLVDNFLGVTRVRPEKGDDLVSNSDCALSDEELDLDELDLAVALETRVGGNASKSSDAYHCLDAAEVVWEWGGLDLGRGLEPVTKIR